MTALTPVPKVLPPEKKDSISIEGAFQPMTLRLFEGGSTLPFYTYVPGDMIAKRDSSAQGERYRFTANFGGKRSDNAFLEIFIFPALMNRDSILAFSKQVRESHLTKGFTSMFDLRMHGQRYYYIAEYYPAEYGDGFGPRAQRILSEWQWVDATSPPRP